jgi:hypothetical protein
MRLVYAMLALGAVLLIAGAAKAEEWRVHEWNGKSWIPAETPKGYPARTVDGRQACLMELVDIANVKPSSVRLQCLQTQRPAPPPSR